MTTAQSPGRNAGKPEDADRAVGAIRTAIGSCTKERIYVRGRDLADELIGKVDFIDMFVLVVLNRMPSAPEKEMLQAMMVTVMDHGFTPSSIAARLTYLGAPEAPQAAVAAGLLGAGSVFLGAMENAAIMLREIVVTLPEPASDQDIGAAVSAAFAGRRQARLPLFGMGHNIHVEGDPRVPALRAVARRCGFDGRHWQVLGQLETEAHVRRGKKLPINAAGAVAATVADMGLPVSMARGLTLVARCAGLIGHIVEEQSAPIGTAVWELLLRQDERNDI